MQWTDLKPIEKIKINLIVNQHSKFVKKNALKKEPTKYWFFGWINLENGKILNFQNQLVWKYY